MAGTAGICPVNSCSSPASPWGSSFLREGAPAAPCSFPWVPVARIPDAGGSQLLQAAPGGAGAVMGSEGF